MEASRTESVPRELPVHLEGLGKEYGHFTALKSLDLTVPEGTALGFLGPNGAGKSTTIKIMTNLIRPSRGRAVLFGIEVRQEPTRALARIGAVIETPEFYGYLSPLETLAYVGRLRGMPSNEIERRSEAVLKEVKLTEWADHRIQEFSKGMKQRLAIAQALLHEPELLILDEPTSGLDPRGMAEVRDVIKSLTGEGRTIFMRSHLLGEVQEVCDDFPRPQGHHVPGTRLVARAALPRPNPGVGSTMTPRPFAQVVTVASYEIRKYIRGRRLLGILILVGLIVGLFLGLPPALSVPYASTPNGFVSTFATFSGLLAVLSGVLFAADALVSEHEKRTGYFLFPNPVRRELLVLGKIAASLIVSAAVLSLYYGAAAVGALIVTRSLTWDVGLSYVYALAYMTAVVGIAYLLSALLKSTVAATV